MIIRGRFVGDAPYFASHLRSTHFQGLVWFLADTGASRTTLLDRDARLLGIPTQALEPALLPEEIKARLIRPGLLEIEWPRSKGEEIRIE
ncbi:MAG: hypothetical protein HYZ81_24485 [Nitrospinae bacterium]|nr:hypothetical protein [Nitrospinota bacterium]